MSDTRVCEFARSDMTPCVVKDGWCAATEGDMCVGCGRTLPRAEWAPDEEPCPWPTPLNDLRCVCGHDGLAHMLRVPGLAHHCNACDCSGFALDLSPVRLPAVDATTAAPLDQHGNPFPDWLRPALTFEPITLGDINVVRDHGTTRGRALVAIIDGLLAKSDTPSDDPPRAADATPSAVVEPLGRMYTLISAAFKAGYLEGAGRADGIALNRAAELGQSYWQAVRAAAWPDKPGEKQLRAEDSTPLDNSNELNSLRAQLGSLTGALEEARRDTTLLDWIEANPRSVTRATQQRTGGDWWQAWTGESGSYKTLREAIAAAARPPETPEPEPSLSEDTDNA